MRSWTEGASGTSSASSAARSPITMPSPPASEQPGAVRIARRVLRTVVEQAALSVPGVARMATLRGGWPRLVGRPLPQHGVSLAIHEQVVTLDLYLIVAPGANMVEVGTAVQEAVGAAVEHILGMEVGAINVYIQDVA